MDALDPPSQAHSDDQGYVVLTYDFENLDECKKEIEAKEDGAL